MSLFVLGASRLIPVLREIAGINAGKSDVEIKSQARKQLNRKDLPLALTTHNAEVEGSSPSLTTIELTIANTAIFYPAVNSPQANNRSFGEGQ